MGLFGKRKSKESAINWVNLTSIEQLQELIKSADEKPVLFFKHSTRCSISSMANSRLENNWDISDEDLTPVYLDLIAHRDVSNKMAELLNVQHESPQVILVKNGEVVYHDSHGNISVDGIKSNL